MAPYGWKTRQAGDDAVHYPVKPIPWVRRVLGDHAYLSISIRSDADPALIDEAASLFPEAMIGRVKDGVFEQVYPPSSQASGYSYHE